MGSTDLVISGNRTLEHWVVSQPDSHCVGSHDFVLQECLPDEPIQLEQPGYTPRGHLLKLDSNSGWTSELVNRVNEALNSYPDAASWIETAPFQNGFPTNFMAGQTYEYCKHYFEVNWGPDSVVAISTKYGRKECFTTYCRRYQAEAQIAKVRRRWLFKFPRRTDIESHSTRQKSTKVWRDRVRVPNACCLVAEWWCPSHDLACHQCKPLSVLLFWQ